MNTFIKKFSFVLITVLAFCASASFAHAYAQFNTHPLDFKTMRASNYTEHPGSDSHWYATENADAGEIISVALYYHNNGTSTANDVFLRITPKVTSNGTTHTFTGRITSSNASTVSDTTTIYTSSSQTLTFIPGTVRWYDTNPISTPISFSTSAENAMFTSGVSAGNIVPGWPTQGSLVARFQVSDSGTPTTYECNDGIDNDGDGYVDYPSDPGCSSSTDDSEYSSGSTSSPNVSTLSATDVDENSADLRGQITSFGATPVVRYFEWDDDSTPSTRLDVPGTTSSTSLFDQTLSGLEEDTTYYFRACIEDDSGEVDCGSVLSFTTDDDVSSGDDHPDVTTRSATDITDDSAELRGDYMTNDFGDVDIAFIWSDDESELEDAIDESSFENAEDYDVDVEFVELNVDEDEEDDVSENITGLDDNARYYFVLCAEYEDGGDDELECGTIREFETDDDGPSFVSPDGEKPDVATTSVSSIGISTATCNATFDSNGSSTQTRIAWGSTSFLGFATAWREQGLSLGVFSEQLTGLLASTTYYCRAEAQNGYGYVTGNTISFRTGSVSLPVAPAPIIFSNQPPQIIIREIERQGVNSSYVILTIENGVDLLGAGDVVVYDVDYENISTTDLKDVVIRVFLPANSVFVGTTQGRYSIEDHAVTVDREELDAGEDGSFQVTAQIETGRDGDAVIATATLVHTHPETEGQEDAIAYDADIFQQLSGVRAFAGGIGLGFTLIGILIAILLIILIMIAARTLYGRRA